MTEIIITKKKFQTRGDPKDLYLYKLHVILTMPIRVKHQGYKLFKIVFSFGEKKLSLPTGFTYLVIKFFLNKLIDPVVYFHLDKKNLSILFNSHI